MLVYCEKCNSKFQVDDSKIPEAGIKGRCSVCAHVFLLKRQPAAVERTSEQGVADFDIAAGVFATSSDFNEAAQVSAAPPVFSAASTHQKVVPAWDVSSFTADDDEIFSSGFGKAEQKQDYEAFSKPIRHTTDDVIFEVEERDQFEEAEEVYEAEEVDEADDFHKVFSADTIDSKATAAHEAFAKFVAQQKHVEEPPDDVRVAPLTGCLKPNGDENNGFGSERLQSQPALETPAVTSTRHPDIVPDGHWPMKPGAQKSDRAIMALLDQQGMTDDYVVQMVQEICHATKYVEGVEKPDWQTRIMGLDMLCKIKGLYASEKKEDPGNRQVQIVTGFNM